MHYTLIPYSVNFHGFRYVIIFVPFYYVKICSVWDFQMTPNESCVGRQEKKPQTAFPISVTQASHIAASVLMGR